MANEAINNTVINAAREANEGVHQSIRTNSDVKSAFDKFDQAITDILASQKVKISSDWVVGGDIDRMHVKNSCAANIINVLAEAIQFGHEGTALCSQAFEHAVNLDIVDDVVKRFTDRREINTVQSELMAKYHELKSQQTAKPEVAGEVKATTTRFTQTL